MDTLPPELIVLVISCLVVGGILVWVFFYFSGRGIGKQRPRKPSTSTQGPAGAPTSTEPSAGPDEQELLCVSRTKKGKLAVFVQGQRCRRLDEVTDLQVRQETVEALKAILAFAEGWLPSQPQAQSSATLPTIDEEAFLAQLRQSNPFILGKGPSSLELPKRPTTSPATKPLKPPADEINELIQQRLKKWPNLFDQKVSLSTNPDGSMRIHVGLRTFKSVDDIPDSRVRALIQDVIREWESK